MDKFKKVFLGKTLVVMTLLMLSSNSASQLLDRGDTGYRGVSLTDPYCGEGGYVETVLGEECDPITSVNLTPNDANFLPTNVSDWVLIELRAVAEGASADAATATTVIKRQSAFLLDTGHVLDATKYRGTNSCASFTVADTGGCPLVEFSFADDDPVEGKDLFVVVRHLNHLDIISESAMESTMTGLVRYIYDFTTNDAEGGILATKRVEISGGVRNAMYLGDVNGDTNINAADYLEILDDHNQGRNDQASDINVDGDVDTSDIASSKLQENLGRASQLP